MTQNTSKPTYAFFDDGAHVEASNSSSVFHSSSTPPSLTEQHAKLSSSTTPTLAKHFLPLSSLSLTSTHPKELLFEGQSIRQLANLHETPLFLYSGRRVKDNVDQVDRALGHFPFARPHQIYYAIKANRCPAILESLRADGRVCIDACSPAEVKHAIAAGFRPQDISVTGFALSNRDLTFLASLLPAGLHINLDGMSQVRRMTQILTQNSIHLASDSEGEPVAQAGGGSPQSANGNINHVQEKAKPVIKVGLRIDPGADNAGHWSKSVYSNSKFGISPRQIPEAVALCRAAGLVVSWLHMHVAWNMTVRDGPTVFATALKVMATCVETVNNLQTSDGNMDSDEAETVPSQGAGVTTHSQKRKNTIEMVDVGGGLGVRFHARADEVAGPILDAMTWASIIHTHLGHLDVGIACEMGTKIVGDAGVLVTEVNTVQTKDGDVRWLGVDSGFNLNCYLPFYSVLQDILHVERAAAQVSEPGWIKNHQPQAPLSSQESTSSTDNSIYTPPAYPESVVKQEATTDVPFHHYHIGGNLNEGIDVFGKDVYLPEVQEGDLLMILRTGAYCASMASHHCGRGRFSEALL